MSAIATENKLIKDYPYFHKNLYLEIEHSICEFFERDVKTKFVGITDKKTVLFTGDEYFVNKIPINATHDFIIKLSGSVVEYFLNLGLGESENGFNLRELTDIEAHLIKSLTVHIYKNLEKKINKDEINIKTIKQAEEYNITLFVRNKNKHAGKIFITLPEYMIPKNFEIELKDNFKIDDFETAYADMPIRVGKSKIELKDVKAIEQGDVILLEESDINSMYVLWDNKKIAFHITPNPSLIIRVDNNGDNNMQEENNTNPQTMWDSILVDIVAEFDSVKLTLGELKQISEGLVIDIGSLYDSKINLKVENQIVASGELVILNDRYGVRIDSVAKSGELKQAAPARPAQKAQPQVKKAAAQPAKQPAAKGAKPQQGDENFDYSDFEIEDESI
ncbi:FliM/FliN family flagellar motor switch protein [bacterium]|nr:FliM/FliN family flagellar motor switch protein [bacterium]